MGVKRIVVSTVAVLLLLVGIVVVGMRLRGVERSSGGALRALPVDAAVVVRVRGGESFTSEWLKSQAVQGLFEHVPFLPAIDLFAQRQLSMAKGLGRSASECFFSVYTPDGMPSQWLSAFEVDDAIDKADALREFLFGRGATILSERTYEGVEVRSARVRVGERETVYYYCVSEGIGLVATYGPLLESAIRTLRSDYTLADNPQFKALLDTNGASRGVVIFMQPSRLFDALSGGLAATWRWAFKRLAQWTPWLTLEVQVEKNAAVATGLSYFNDSIRSGALVMQGSDPMRMVAPSVLPSRCDFFLRWADARAGESLGVLPCAVKNVAVGFTEPGRREGLQLLRGIGSGEIVLAHLAFPELPERHRWAVVVSSQSPSLAVQKLVSSICPSGEPLRRGIDRTQSLDVYKTLRPDFFRVVLSPLFGDSVASYFMAADGAVVFASSQETLERVAISGLRGQTLRNDVTFGNLSDRLKGESNFSLYVAPGLRGESVVHLFALRPRDTVAWGWFSRLRGGVLQLTAGRDIVFYNVAALLGDSAESADAGSCAAWETRLDAPVARRPLLVESHVARGKEILAQDTIGNLYLLNGLGRILWKRSLSEQILGEPQQVDLYRNGKLQYAFATPTAIWVVDRNGNDVEGFPLRMPHRVTAPLGVFDYDGTRDYRFMVCLDDCSARIYDARAKWLPDFAPGRFDLPIVAQPLHVRAAGKDFIVVRDAQRFYLLNRRGAERLSPSEPIAQLVGASVAFSKERAELFTVDASGALCNISLADGAVRRVALRGSGAVRGALVLGGALQGEACAVVAREKAVDFCSEDGAVVASHRFAGDIDPKMYLFQFAMHDWRVGVREVDGDRLWLLDMRGNAVKGFPVAGDTGFTIGHLEGSSARFNLIVGSAPSLLINYLLPE